MSRSLQVVLTLLGLSLVALGVTGDPLYSRFAYLWVGVLLVGWLWSHLSLRAIRVRRQPRHRRAQVGVMFEERLEVVNEGRLPCPWVEVHDRSSLPGSRSSRVLVALPGRNRRSYLARTRLVQRGLFSLGPTEIALSDPFGLFRTARTFPAEATLLVYPMTVRLRSFPSPSGLLPGGEALRRRTHQVTPNAVSIREYVPSDPLARIHWPSTARKGRLMSKVFELDPLSEVWVVVDGDAEAQAGLLSPSDRRTDVYYYDPLRKVELPPTTEEYAVSIAASVARYFLERRRAVGLIARGASFSVIPPDRGGRQLLKVLEALALFRADGDVPLAAVVGLQARQLPRGSLVVLITPSTDPGVAVAADLLLRRALRPVVILLDAASFGGLEGTADLAARVSGMDVPICQVACGDDLAQAMEQFSPPGIMSRGAWRGEGLGSVARGGRG